MKSNVRSISCRLVEKGVDKKTADAIAEELVEHWELRKRERANVYQKPDDPVFSDKDKMFLYGGTGFCYGILFVMILIYIKSVI